MQQPSPGGLPPPMQVMASHPAPQNMSQMPAYPNQFQQPPSYMMMMPPVPQNQPSPMAMWQHQGTMQPQMPLQQQQQVFQPQQQQLCPPATADEVRTLWIGDLQYWMDEAYIWSCLPQNGEVAFVKVIRNKLTNQSEGYGFIEFCSREAAESVLQAYNGTPMLNAEQNFRLNWASFSGGDKRGDSPDYTIFVGDLSADVTDYMLQETFRSHYPSVKGAKVVMDKLTGRSKGYGFVRFSDESEQTRAMGEMNGVFCSTRPMRVGIAVNKKSTSDQPYSNPVPQSSQAPSDTDPTNTTVFVGNLDSNVTEEHLNELFGQYGQLSHVKIPLGKRCGFVQFVDRSCAEEALRRLNGAQLSGQNIRLSWGRNPNKQPAPDSSQWNGSGYYGYAEGGYENYNYAAAVSQDPNVYYGGYPGHFNYQHAQQ